MNEADAVMTEFAEEKFYPSDITFRLLRRLPLDRVDEYMAAFPEDVREIAIAHVQETFASGVELIRFSEMTAEDLAHEEALIDWVRRQGRYHFPRRPDEPDVAAASKRLGEPPDYTPVSQVIARPWKLITLYKPEELDERLDALDEDELHAVLSWAKVRYAEHSPPPLPRRLGHVLPGSEEVLIAWLRRHGHLALPTSVPVGEFVRDRPRPHHFQMKYLLVRLAIDNPVRFFETFGPGGDADYLVDLWAAAGGRLAATERVSSDGLSCDQRSDPDGVTFLRIVLPRAEVTNEAMAIVAVRVGSRSRVFALERSDDPRAAAVLVEVSAEGRASWGPAAADAGAALLESVGRIVRDPAAQPLVFAEIDPARHLGTTDSD